MIFIKAKLFLCQLNIIKISLKTIKLKQIIINKKTPVEFISKYLLNLTGVKINLKNTTSYHLKYY